MYGRSLFQGIDYTGMLTNSAITTARRLGADESLSSAEALSGGAIALGSGWCAAKTVRVSAQAARMLLRHSRRWH